MDEPWIVHVDQEISRKRLAERRHQKGIGKDLGKSYEKYVTSDGKNNRFMVENRGPVNLILENNVEWELHEPDQAKETEVERQTNGTEWGAIHKKDGWTSALPISIRPSEPA